MPGWQGPWTTTIMGLWLWREMQAVLWLVDPWGATPKVKKLEGWIPRGQRRAEPLYVCAPEAEQGASSGACLGWAAALAWARHGGYTSAIQAKTVALKPSHSVPGGYPLG